MIKRRRNALYTLILFLSGCNPFYVIQAGITQSEILLNRRDITDVMSDPDTSPEIQRKLELVTSARDYTEKLALSPGGTFRSYSALDRDILAWIVLASKPDSFSFYTWWFPIVGSVPYKGYFSPEAARGAAEGLQEKGYETLVRGTEAFSTLGWFNDPVMTPMLKNDDCAIVTTVIHEVLHTTLWIPNHVAFNESLANFIGHQGAISYFRHQNTRCREDDEGCREEAKKNLRAAEENLIQALAVSDTLSALIPELKELYQSDRSRDEKLKERELVFAKHIDTLRKRIPGLKILKKAHNAELMQLQLYYSKLALFRTLWENLQEDWGRAIEQMKLIAEESQQQEIDPFELLKSHMEMNSPAILAESN